ncbi:MAG TPA: 23S rRNA (pseudouridine(1915)-N(3))-methyltransferase RlmH [Bacillota bacterium]|nr:23S rRNA (pseudouridine(1915)-N(3))-methyltransferase RlmH [Bacillota bacterium]
MNIQVICVGRLKEEYWTEALSEYRKRLGKYCSLSIEEVKEERLPDNAKSVQEEIVKKEEGKRILERIRTSSYVIALDIRGTELSSEAMAEKINGLCIRSRSDITFIIGGSLGLSKDVLSKSDFRLSFSKMTFPHQMMRIILLEQLYRSFKINRNEIYHK